MTGQLFFAWTGFDPSEVVRLADWIQAEGCIYITNDRKDAAKSKHTLRLSVHNTDPAIVHWIADRFGGRIRTHTWKHHKRAWAWFAQTGEAIRIIDAIEPYCIIKHPEVWTAQLWATTYTGDTAARLSDGARNLRRICYHTMRMHHSQPGAYPPEPP